MEGVIRLLPYADADGATNMAADETLVRSAAHGIASLRFYGWTTATLSLGYFQPCAVRLTDPLLAQLPWVRRPSGGATLVHHHELTYAIALPIGPGWHSAEPWLTRMHRIIQTAIAGLGAAQFIAPVRGESIKHGDVLCFQQFTPGDLLSGGKKVVGSAQRRYRQALMQHGSILLAQSEYTPALPGLRETIGIAVGSSELQDLVLRAFASDMGWHAERDGWSDDEKVTIAELRREKYAAPSWNEKR
ncbi:MAG: lipoate--protein ligase family protein [Planctomycetes bacterium]|nr:lipoate--protein ligase family protein [Planctomycetota bacterium]